MKNKRFIITMLILLAALLIGLGFANAQTKLLDSKPYRGNIYNFPVLDIPLDDSATYTAKLYYSKLGAALPAQYQPTVTKSLGLLRVKLNATTALPGLAFLQILANGQTKWYGNVFTGKAGGSPNEDEYLSLWQILMTYNY